MKLLPGGARLPSGNLGLLPDPPSPPPANLRLLPDPPSPPPANLGLLPVTLRSPPGNLRLLPDTRRLPPSGPRLRFGPPRRLPGILRLPPSIPRPSPGTPRVRLTVRKALSGPRLLLRIPRPRRGTARTPTSARRAFTGLRLWRELPGGDLLMLVAGRMLPMARGCAGIPTRRHRERLRGSWPLRTAVIRRAMWTLPAAGPPSGPRAFRRGRRRGGIWTHRLPGRRGDPRNFLPVIPGTGIRTRRLGRRSDRRPWSLVGTCLGTLTARCSDPRRRRFGILWRFRGPRSRFGGRCRDPRCGGRDPATGVTGPTAGRGGGGPGRCLPTWRPLPGRRGGGSGWWPWC
jgi:hypothetical protein